MRFGGQFVAATLLAAVPVLSKSVSTDVELDEYAIWTGPLTTTFTPAPTCLSQITTRQYRPGRYPDLEVGCQGPGGNECCPDGWGQFRYFSPGVCPSGYQACALPTTRQRQETTNMCCPMSFDCPRDAKYGLCRSSLNTVRTSTYMNEKNSVETATWYAVSATPIQIRFRQNDSDVVPIPTDSFKLPPPPTEEELERERKAAEPGLHTGAKAAIGLGVVFLILVVVLTVWWEKRKKAAQKEKEWKRVPTLQPEADDPTMQASDNTDTGPAPPPYSKK
ncbi:hypothetical protein HJFPF1_13160 [Paramyrothecium foliicola]|nr:hypothetical protein HJFPF1_13160 [Paramyrothecium foliicola]